MAHKSEFVADNIAGNGGGFSVLNSGTKSEVISQSGGKLSLVNGSSDPTATGQLTYVTGTGFRAYGAAGVFTIPTSGGGGGSDTLDSAYENGRAIVLDAGAITLADSTTSTAHSMDFTQSGAKSGDVIHIDVTGALTGNTIAIAAGAAMTGNALDLDMNLGIAAGGIYLDCGATARTGSDIQVKDDSTGNHSIINLDKSGAGASIGLDYQESYNGSSASFVVKATLDNADGIDTTVLQAVRGTGIRTAPVIDINDASTGSAAIIDVDLTGVFTGNIFDFASSAAATGNVININLDSAVAATAIRIEGSGVRTQPYIELITDSTSSASLIDISVDGAITGTAAIDIDMNLGLAGSAIYIDAGGGTRTANLVEIKNDGDGDVDLFSIVSTNTGSGAILDLNMDGIDTGEVLNVDMNAAVGAEFLKLDAGGGTRTVDLIDVTFDGDGDVGYLDITCTNTGSGNIIEVDCDSVHTGNLIALSYGTGAATGNAIDITTGTNLAGQALAITTAGVRTAPVILISGAATDGGTDDHIFDINQSGQLDSNVIDITYSSAASTGDALKIAMGTAVAGTAINIVGTGVRTDDLIQIDSDATGAGLVADINITGAGSGNVFDVTYSVGANTGNAIDLNMGTNVAGMAISVGSAATGVTGEGAAFDVAHTGALAAGADLVRLYSTGSHSSTSNMLSIEQETGACTSGSYGLYINVTGTNIEAIKVDAGTVTFDETLTVTGITTLTGGLGGKLIGTSITATTGADAVAVTGTLHEITTTGTGDAYTLANGTAGQRLSVIYVAEGAGADTAIITPTTLAGGSTITLNALGDSADLVYSSTGGWYVLGLGGAAAVA